MSTFQPSQSQHVNSAYGTYGGDENETHWYDILDPTQAIASAKALVGYGPTSTGGQVAASTPATKAVSKATGKLATGRYKGPGGYIYSYNSGTGDITIVVSPKGGAGKVLAPGSAANKAVYAEILAQGTIASDAEVRASKTSKSLATSPTAPASPDIPPAASTDDKNKDAIYKQPWFPFAVGGGILLIGIFAYALWPEKPQKKLPVQVIMRERAPASSAQRAPAPALRLVQDEQEEAEEAA